MIQNGIIVSKRYAVDTFIRFAFDPIAENFAAIALAKKCGAERQLWKALEAKINDKKAHDFSLVLQIVQTAYSKIYGWQNEE